MTRRRDADDKTDIPRVDAPTHHHDPADSTPRGTLILIGGACSAHGHALRAFLDLIDARAKGRIVGLTTASAEPREAADHWRATFAAAGASNVEIPMFDRADTARDREIAGLVAAADGVFLGGGDQVKLVAALSGTRTSDAIYELYRKGGTICGTSAGAAALTELTMAGGEIDEEGNLVEQYLGPGLGLLGYDAIVDTHFSQRRRLQRLFLVVASNRQLFGIGIDEDTALIVRGDRGEVIGAGVHGRMLDQHVRPAGDAVDDGDGGRLVAVDRHRRAGNRALVHLDVPGAVGKAREHGGRVDGMVEDVRRLDRA